MMYSYCASVEKYCGTASVLSHDTTMAPGHHTALICFLFLKRLTCIAMLLLEWLSIGGRGSSSLFCQGCPGPILSWDLEAGKVKYSLWYVWVGIGYASGRGGEGSSYGTNRVKTD